MQDPDVIDARIIEPARRKFPWGWLLGGCLTAVLLMLGGTAALFATGYYYYKVQLTEYTSTEAKELPIVELDEAELEKVEKRVETFQEQLEKEETPDQLVLTAEDINALISRNKNLRGRVFVTIQDGQIGADVSYPTDKLPGGKGRFFNGSVTANVELKDGELVVEIETASVNGNDLPDAAMQQLQERNLAQDFLKDPEVAKVFNQFESLVIEDDRIVLTPRSKETETEETSPNDAVEQPAL